MANLVIVNSVMTNLTTVNSVMANLATVNLAMVIAMDIFLTKIFYTIQFVFYIAIDYY